GHERTSAIAQHGDCQQRQHQRQPAHEDERIQALGGEAVIADVELHAQHGRNDHRADQRHEWQAQRGVTPAERRAGSQRGTRGGGASSTTALRIQPPTIQLKKPKISTCDISSPMSSAGSEMKLAKMGSAWTSRVPNTTSSTALPTAARAMAGMR